MQDFLPSAVCFHLISEAACRLDPAHFHFLHSSCYEHFSVSTVLLSIRHMGLSEDRVARIPMDYIDIFIIFHIFSFFSYCSLLSSYVLGRPHTHFPFSAPFWGRSGLDHYDDWSPEMKVHCCATQQVGCRPMEFHCKVPHSVICSNSFEKNAALPCS